MALLCCVPFTAVRLFPSRRGRRAAGRLPPDSGEQTTWGVLDSHLGAQWPLDHACIWYAFGPCCGIARECPAQYFDFRAVARPFPTVGQI